MGQDEGELDRTDTLEVSHAALATQVLADDVGTWDAELEIRMRPGAEPMLQKGVGTRRLVGERWLVVDFAADSGFAGHGVYGWDAATQRYTGVWVDTMGGAMARAVGSYDVLAATMTYELEVEHAGRIVRYREVTRAVDADTRVYTHHLPLPGGGEHELMRITYRRRRG